MTEQHFPAEPMRAPRTTSSLLGRVSFGLAVLVAVGSVTSSTVVQSVFLSSNGVESIQAVYGAYAIVGSLISLVALVLGIVALTDRSRPRLAAAAGTALAASFLFSTIASLVSSALFSALA